VVVIVLFIGLTVPCHLHRSVSAECYLLAQATRGISVTCTACNGDFPYYVYSADFLTGITTHVRIFMIIIVSIFMVVVVCNLITHLLLPPDLHKQELSMHVLYRTCKLLH